MTVQVKTRCPLCDTEGWTTFARLDGYTALCGTVWGGGFTEPRQAPMCRIVAALRWEVTFLRLLSEDAA